MKSIEQGRTSEFLTRTATIVGIIAVFIATLAFAAHSVGATQATPLAVLKTLYTFTGGADGAEPYGTLIQDAQGNLYGTTAGGGSGIGGAGYGVVFELTPTGTETVLYTFTGGADGASPLAGLFMDAKGNLYGTTQTGGTSGECLGIGCGVVFKLSPPTTQGQPWTETVLHAFTGNADGGNPYAGLIADTSGNLYGTTFVGGYGGGVVYKINGSGKETVLYNFCSVQYCDDGEGPQAGLIRNAEGQLYGTTFQGGINDTEGTPGDGVIFKLDPDNRETVLVGYSNTGADGAYPRAGVIQDSTGNLYGTTSQGGNQCGEEYCGVVFEYGADSKYTVLYYFKGGTDGAFPGYGSLLRDEKGNLYGTTGLGGSGSCTGINGATGCGTIFRVTASGQETVLYSFQGKTDGAFPEGGLNRDRTDKVLGYGTTAGAYNGAYGYGTIFEIARR